MVVEESFPPVARLNGIQCSTAHISEADNNLLFTLSHQHEDFGESEWIMYTDSGYLIRLDAWAFPVPQLRRRGLSRSCRKLVITMMRHYGISYIHLDAFAEILPGFVTFDW